MARTLKEEPANGIGGVVAEASDTEFDVAVGEFVDNVVCIAQRSNLLIEFSHDQSRPVPTVGQLFPEFGSRPAATTARTQGTLSELMSQLLSL